MISKSTISFIQSLKQKKFRQKYNKFVLEGEKIILEALNENYISFDSIFCLPEKTHLFESYNDNIIEINAKTLLKISNLKTPPGILAIANASSINNLQDLKVKKITLFLDDIKDPGNLGTILRTAEWFGCTDIIASPETVELYNPKVIQASMGSFARVNYYVSKVENIRSVFSETNIISSSLEGMNLYEYQPVFPMILCIGNESRGISESVKKFSDQLVMIPKANHSKAESLNAAIANAVLLSYFSQKK